MTDVPHITRPCCDVWLPLVPTFDWYRLNDVPDLLVMPCLLDTQGQPCRVNWCPSCGADTRSAVVRDWRLL